MTVRFFSVTVIDTVVVSVLYATFVGTKVTDNTCVPTVSFVVAAGV